MIDKALSPCQMPSFCCKIKQTQGVSEVRPKHPVWASVSEKACRSAVRNSRAFCSSNSNPGEFSTCNRRTILSKFAAISLWLSARSSDATEDAAEIQNAVFRVFDKTAGKAKAPVLLRLVFHDSGTFSKKYGDGGANASIRYELKRPENSGLNRGWKVIDQTMQGLTGTIAEGKVSHADLIALGGAYAVSVTNGPKINIPIGRSDASSEDPQDRLPLETASADDLLQIFEDKGFTTQDFVALSGSHTLGNKGFGEPLVFDNAYYTALLKKPWTDKSNEMAAMIGLPSDHVLSDSQACLPFIEKYAENQQLFYKDFSSAYLKLTTLGTNLA